MLKRPFFKFRGPSLYYSSIKEDAVVKEIPFPSKAVLLLEKDSISSTELDGYIGSNLKTGQRVEIGTSVFYSPVTGKVAHVFRYTGYLNREYFALAIETEQDEWEEPSVDSVPVSIPGLKNVTSLMGFEPPVNHVMIMGMDTDLFVTTNQLALKDRMEDIKKGIYYLRRLANIGKVSFVVPPELVPYVDGLDCEFYTLKPRYPNAIPKLIMKSILKKVIPAGKEPRDMGIEFIGAEAVANMGSLAEGKRVFDKLITVIDKEYSIIHIKARVGTPIGYILNVLDIGVKERDRVIIGGPMRGYTTYSPDSPVDYDTDAIFVQDSSEIIPTEDTHCINCGECVKVCPVNVPVNMLIRVLENSLFEEAAMEYDLLSCVECGLCSYVCIARIPIFQYIMLGKYELSKMGEENV